VGGHSLWSLALSALLARQYARIQNKKEKQGAQLNEVLKFHTQ